MKNYNFKNKIYNKNINYKITDNIIMDILEYYHLIIKQGKRPKILLSVKKNSSNKVIVN